jgi:hypothetical protein
MTTIEKHHVHVDNARKFADWLNTRGGILIWKSQDLGSAGRSVSTPARTLEGADYPSPGWQFTKPDRLITDPAEVEVYTSKVVETFPIKLKQQGMKIVLTNASDRKVRAALARHGDSAHYIFGATGTSQGSTPHALLSGGEDTVSICIDDTTIPLQEWLAKNPPAP